MLPKTCIVFKPRQHHLTRQTGESGTPSVRMLGSPPEGYGTTVGACTGQALGKSPASPECARFPRENTRAALQWKLEGPLASFEDGFVKQAKNAKRPEASERCCPRCNDPCAG
jgi:hypothetical protein